MILQTCAIGSSAITEWPTPRKVKEVQSFLGFGNFYRKFIKDFSAIARPLYDLTKKGNQWEWTTECEESFQTLKRAFVTAPVLIMPDKEKPFRVETDASGFATGGVLSQQDENGDWHPCMFISQTMTEAERNYDIYDKELLGIIRALEEWRHYLEGAKFEFDIYTDHKNLAYFREAQKLNRRQARWALYLSRFHFKLHHKPGKQNIIPDILTRKAGYDLGGGVIITKKSFFPTMSLPRHTNSSTSVG